jgi:chromosome segregation ATPase
MLGGALDESCRPSLLPGSDQVQERKTLLDQRAMFEQLKAQFNDTQTAPMMETDEVQQTDSSRDHEFEAELRLVRKENVELSIKNTALQDELSDKAEESSRLLTTNAVLTAEIQDLKLQLDQDAASNARMSAENAALVGKVSGMESDLAASQRRLTAAEERLLSAEEDIRSARAEKAQFQAEREAFEAKQLELQVQAEASAARCSHADLEIQELRDLSDRNVRMAEAAERARVEGEADKRLLELEVERLRADLLDANQERTKIKEVVDELIQSEGQRRSEEQEREVEKWKKQSKHFEREYNQSKQLNADMMKHMAQITQSASERSDSTTDIMKENKSLQRQLDSRNQELRSVKLDKEEVQKQLDALQSQGSYFQDKYKEANNELRQLRIDESCARATAAKLKSRVESLCKENEDLKAQISKQFVAARAAGDDSVRIEAYEKQVNELQLSLKKKDEDLAMEQRFVRKSQAVNDCLNTLLVLESEQSNLLQDVAPVQDSRIRSQLETKKSKAHHVIKRLNEIMNNEGGSDFSADSAEGQLAASGAVGYGAAQLMVPPTGPLR